MAPDGTRPRSVPRRLAAEICSLDQDQRSAVVAEGNLVITAGPGSGKTRTVVARAGYLLSTKVSPLRGMATITYTNQAAAELREGLARIGVIEPQRLFAGTLHAFCLAHVLPYAQLVGVDLPGLDKLMTAAETRSLEQESADDVGVNVWALREVFPSLRRRMAAGEDLSDDRSEHVRAVERYELLCSRRGVWDFEGIVLSAVRLLEEHPDVAAVVYAKFPVVMIDEYQDLGAGLHRLVELLLAAGVEVTVVGDADQSIYGFTGGDPTYLEVLCARDDFVVRKLVINYRCGSAVVAAAELTLENARGYRSDPARADPGTLEFEVVAGSPAAQASKVAESVRRFLAAGIKPNELAVLLRNWSPLAPLVERELLAAGVSVQHGGLPTGPSTELGKWLEAAAFYAVHMAREASDSPPQVGADRLLDRLESLQRRAGLPRSGAPRLARLMALHHALLGDDPLAGLSVQAWLQHAASALALRRLAENVGDPRSVDELHALMNCPSEVVLADLASDTAGTGKVVVTTFHGAKGRTFSAVIVPGLTEGVVPPWTGPTSRQIPLTGARLEEERRSFYVALTRSRGSVLLQLSRTGVDMRKYTITRGYSSFATQLAERLGAPLTTVS